MPPTLAIARTPIVEESSMMTWTMLQHMIRIENRLEPEFGFFSDDGSIDTDGDPEIIIGDVTVSIQTGTVKLSGKVNFTNGTNPGIIRIRKDSLTGAILDQSGISVADETVNLIAVDTAPALSQTYTLTLQRSSGEVASSVEFRRLIADNRKR
jgi:hypothetical protein